MSTNVPERIAWTVSALRPRRTDAILEIGCGNGLAAALLLPQLTSGKLVALDRSVTALRATRRRLEPWLRSGRASLSRGSLASLRLAEESFDRAFAINVNVFWRDPSAELEVLRRLLRPSGGLMLVFDPPSASQLVAIAEKVEAHLRRAGFERVVAEIQRLERSSLACIRGVTPAAKRRRLLAKG